MGIADDGASQVFAVATRLSQLDENGYIAVGADVFVTDKLIKATITPVKETGDDLVAKTAAGDIGEHYKHPDMIKYWTVQLDVVTPNAYLENLLCGGTVLEDNATALATPGTITTTPAATGGQLPNGDYAYKVTAANQYGETVASAEATATVTGATGDAGSVALSITAVSGAVYYRWYGRVAGEEQFIAQTLDASFTDTGAITPFGALPGSNTTAGPGQIGYQDPTLGPVGNPNGVGIEFWAKAIKNGKQVSTLPYWRWVLPLCHGFIREASDITDAFFGNIFSGFAEENPNFGTGPVGDCQFDTSKVRQRVRAAATTLPVASSTLSTATA